VETFISITESQVNVHVMVTTDGLNGLVLLPKYWELTDNQFNGRKELPMVLDHSLFITEEVFIPIESLTYTQDIIIVVGYNTTEVVLT